MSGRGQPTENQRDKYCVILFLFFLFLCRLGCGCLVHFVFTALSVSSVTSGAATLSPSWQSSGTHVMLLSCGCWRTTSQLALDRYVWKEHGCHSTTVAKHHFLAHPLQSWLLALRDFSLSHPPPPCLFQYIVLNCPGVSSFENHPFTLTTVRFYTMYFILVDQSILSQSLKPYSIRRWTRRSPKTWGLCLS